MRRQHHPFPGADALARVGGDGLEHVLSGAGAHVGEVAARATLHVQGIGRTLGRGIGRQVETARRGGQHAVPVRLGQVQALRRDRVVDHAALAGARQGDVAAGGVVFLDLLPARGARGAGISVQGHDRLGRVRKQRIHAVMKQRQPMFHAGKGMAGGDRLVQRVLAPGRAEQLAITGAEPRDGLRIQRQFAHRLERSGIRLARGALADGIEQADGVHLVAEQVQPQGLRPAGREQVQQPAAHGVFARLHDLFGAHIAGAAQKAQQRLQVQALARADGKGGLGERLARGHALAGGIDRGDDQQRLGRRRVRRQRGQGGERLNPAGENVGMGRHPVIGHAVPGRQVQHPQVGRHEAGCLHQHGQPHVVTRDVQHGAALARAGQRDQNNGVMALGHAGQGGAAPGLVEGLFDLSFQHGRSLFLPAEGRT